MSRTIRCRKYGEELEGLDDALDRAPGGLQALNDGHHRAGCRNNHRNELLDQNLH